MDVYVRRDGRWQAVSGQLTPPKSESRVKTFVPRDFAESFLWTLAFQKISRAVVVGSKREFRFRR